ncbi:MAG: site-2 protease family protein [Methanomassiliicoccales archaeon]|nr:site-2 protease family protein [Methanomassiliicoccales archaeon]
MATREPAAEVESIKAAVSKYFPIYDVRVSYDALTFFVSPDLSTLDQRFDKLRGELKGRMMIPILKYSGGEYTISVVKRPEMRTRGLWLNGILLIITLITTIIAGAVLWASYAGNNDLMRLENYLWGGLFFALPLMAILGTHELSHYLAAKRCGLAASLPFFIPSIPPLGTFGAFISIRDPIPDRKSLVEIGAAGPIGGLLVAIPVTLIGLWLTSMGEPSTGMVGDSGAVAIMVQPLYALLTLFIPLPENVTLHPTAFAAWVGFLVTAINLLPAGQLDGGHVARGLFGDKAKYLSYATVGLLLVLGMYYSGWLLFALLIVFLGLKHPAPLNDITKLDVKRKVLGVFALGILLVTFSPIPLVEIAPDHSFDIEMPGGNETVMMSGSSVYVTMYVNNTGNTNSTITMNVMQVPSNWSVSLFVQGDPEWNATDLLEVLVPYNEGIVVIMKITVPPGDDNATWNLLIEISSLNSNLTTYLDKEIIYTVKVE